MYSVYQHWDPLKVCVVGQTYPPEFYNFIEDIKIREVMQGIATETEEDLRGICKTLEKFGVSILRPIIDTNFEIYKKGKVYLPAPLTPRDDMAMIGETFYSASPSINNKWNRLRGESWPLLPPKNQEEFESLPNYIKHELSTFGVRFLHEIYYKDYGCLSNIVNHIAEQGNTIIYDRDIDSAMVCRLGKDLFFGTWTIGKDHSNLQHKVSELFPDYHCHILETGGHLDGCICPVCPGLLLSTLDMNIQKLQQHFPEWEVFYVKRFTPNNNFLRLKRKNKGNWWVPGEESNSIFTNYVENYFSHWLGNIEETSIDVNLLIINPKNVLVSQYNEKLFNKLHEYGVTAHVTPLRHSNFWDGGVHCVTNDLNRIGNSISVL